MPVDSFDYIELGMSMKINWLISKIWTVFVLKWA